MVVKVMCSPYFFLAFICGNYYILALSNGAVKELNILGNAFVFQPLSTNEPNINSYGERFEHYVKVQNINEEQQLSLLYAVIGWKAY